MSSDLIHIHDELKRIKKKVHTMRKCTLYRRPTIYLSLVGGAGAPVLLRPAWSPFAKQSGYVQGRPRP